MHYKQIYSEKHYIERGECDENYAAYIDYLVCLGNFLNMLTLGFLLRKLSLLLSLEICGQLDSQRQLDDHPALNQSQIDF